MNQVIQEYMERITDLMATVSKLEREKRRILNCADLMAECLDNTNQTHATFPISMQALREYLALKEELR